MQKNQTSESFKNLNKMDKKTIPIREGIFTIPNEPDEHPRLLGSRCKVCDKIFFPSRKICSNCFHEEMEIISLSTQGKLYTYTIVGYPPPGISGPYAIGYVDLPEGVRVFSILTDWRPEDLKIGKNFELALGKFKDDEEGNEIVTYKFKPIWE
jgi:uncharacterized OB-fold protein